MGDNGLPMLSLVDPQNRTLTIHAELVPRGSPMNDEPDAWLRKTLVVVLWILGSILLCAFFALLAAGSSSSSSSSSTTTGSIDSGPVRRTTLTMSLAPYFGQIVLKSKHGIFNRLWAALFGSWVEVGDPAFDAMFWIGGPREHACA